ncbi:hypothetical protein WJ968_14705 [Achromobacter xylosoxidans]
MDRSSCASGNSPCPASAPDSSFAPCGPDNLCWRWAAPCRPICGKAWAALERDRARAALSRCAAWASVRLPASARSASASSSASSKAVHQRGGASVRAATSPRLYQSAGKACLGSGLGPIDTQPGSANVAASSPSHRRLPSSSMFPRTFIACHHPSPFDDSLR